MSQPKKIEVPYCPLCQCQIDVAGLFYEPDWDHPFFGKGKERLNMHDDGAHFHFCVVVNGRLHHRYAFLEWRSRGKQEVPK